MAIFMSMPNVEPNSSRSGSAPCVASTVPDPSSSGCFDGSVSRAKMRSAEAGTVAVMATLRSVTGSTVDPAGRLSLELDGPTRRVDCSGTAADRAQLPWHCVRSGWRWAEYDLGAGHGGAAGQGKYRVQRHGPHLGQVLGHRGDSQHQAGERRQVDR